MRLSRLFFLPSILLLTICFSGTGASTQSLEVLYRQAMIALDRGDQRSAQNVLRQMQERNEALFRKNNLDYLLARLLQQGGNLESAATLYRTVADRGSVLAEFAWRHLAEIARARKNLEAEREALMHLLGTNPASTLAPDAHRALAESYLSGGDYPFAIAVLQALASVRSARGRDSMARLGAVYAMAGDTARERETFAKLLGSQSDDAALSAAKGLDELDRDEDRDLTEAEDMLRGRIYLENREFGAARSHYERIAAAAKSPRSIAEAMFAVGRSYYLEENTGRAIEWYKRLHGRFPESAEGETAYYQVGHARQKAGLYRDAVRRYNEFIDAYPKSQWLGGAYLNAIDSLRAAGLTTEALVWCRRAQEDARLKSDIAAVTAVFDEAKVYLDQNKFDQALAVFDRMLRLNLTRSGPGSARREEVQLLRGYCLEKMGETDRAMGVYLSIPAGPRSYWGERASHRLQALAKTPAGTSIAQAARHAERTAKQAERKGAWVSAREEATLALRLTDDEDAVRALQKILARAYSKLPAFRPAFSSFASPARTFLSDGSKTPSDRKHATLGKELAFLGLYDEALPELTAALSQTGDISPAEIRLAPSSAGSRKVEIAQRRRRHPAKRTAASATLAFSIALLAARNDRADIAIRFGEPALRSLPGDVVVAALPRTFALVAYPIVNREMIVSESGKNRFDPRLLLAIAKHESRFDPYAKSPAAARGLLQFTAATAAAVLPSTDLKNFNLEDLYRPVVSIKLGAALLDKLGKQFPGNPFAIAAAYNASPEAVARWIARARDDDPDRFVSEIGYRETKDYVQRVMASYWVYKSLFDEHLSVKK